MASQGTSTDEHHFHGGPFAGEFLDRAQIPDSAFERGYWALRYERASRNWYGHYARDNASAGGRNWDWVDA